MVRRMVVSALTVAGMLGASYGGDYAWLKYREARGLQPFGLVTVHRYYVIAEKNNRSEFKSIPDEDQKCTISLFAHIGYAPCWYLRGHAEQAVQM